MSIDFCPTYNTADIEGYEIVCANPDVDDRIVLAVRKSWNDAKRFSKDHMESCEDCFYIGGCLLEPITDTPVLNTSSANGAHLLELLGLVDEVTYTDVLGFNMGGSEGGDLPAEDFLGRVLLAQGLAPSDAGVPMHDVSGETGPTLIQCGRRSGYADEKLLELERIARWALAHGRNVQWC